MLKTTKISRRSALKLLFVTSVIPSLFITSCTKTITSPESTEINSSRLEKTNFDNKISLIEKFVVANDKEGYANIPTRYLHSRNYSYVLARVGENNQNLKLQRVEVVSNGANKTYSKVIGLQDEAIILANPSATIESLKKINEKLLRKKFKLGRKQNFWREK